MRKKKLNEVLKTEREGRQLRRWTPGAGSCEVLEKPGLLKRTIHEGEGEGGRVLRRLVVWGGALKLSPLG